MLTRTIRFTIALLLCSLASAQTAISLPQLPSLNNCKLPSSAQGQPIILLAVPTPGPSPFTCYQLVGVTLIPGTPTAAPQIVINAPPTPVPVFVYAEVPTGTIDGTNASFTIKSPPSPAASLEVYRNGLMQRLGVDYTLVSPPGNTIQFTAVSIPQPGDLLIVYYRTS